MNAPHSATPRPVIPRATYRLQLHRDFGFDAARALLPYLQRLGVSHVYCSPIMRARPGSRHGYDVVDHAQINPELGGMAGFAAFAEAARALGLGLLLDQVPNHMGVFGADNGWWQDVLEHGPASQFAAYFDIDWQPPNPALHGKLLLPVLGDAYGEVLDRGEIQLRCEAEAGTLTLHYYEHRFPLDPASYALALQAAAQRGAGTAAVALRALASECRALPPRHAPVEAAAAPVPARRDSCRRMQQRLARLLQRDRHAAAALHGAVAEINGEAGRDRLHALHELQAYRLADWRMAADEINYRRFFDINELAAVRVEDERVFEAVQGLVLDLAAQGRVDGLRIDHPDGLLDPAAYFGRLQLGLARRLGGDTGARPLYLVVEKIVAAHEELPRDWAVHGTTGYRFSNLVNGLFVERRNRQRMERIWRDFGGDSEGYERIVPRCKRSVARGAMAAQLTTLTQALQRIALADRRTRDYGVHMLRDALAEVAAAMPVYRSYVVAQASAQDRQFIDWAVAQARRRSHALAPALFDFVRQCLLAQALPGAGAEQAGRVRAFAMAFQQFCAPVAAKGIEDTAFYRYHRLVSLNEVGGDPASFGVSASAFHGANRDRQRHWPHTMLATSTHDHKRSEDVRCRIDVLSEVPAAWRLAMRRWKTQTRSWRVLVDGALAPSGADLMLLHQTLLGTLPAEGLDARSLPAYRERIEAYMLKAAREAKLHTDWIGPETDYEAALLGTVRGLLGRLDGNPVLADLQARARRIAWFGAWNSLAMTVLKCSAPGVPDLYQGSELIELSLVDPDNRRPVDYALRRRLLDELEALRAGGGLPTALAAMAQKPEDGRLKLWLAWRLLALRREQPALFRDGAYVALRVLGDKRRHALAFARRTPQATLLVAVARKFAQLGGEPGTPPVGAALWAGTEVRRPDWLPRGPLRAVELFSEREVEIGAGALPLAERFADLPLAALWLPGDEHGGA
ncbi:MAG TPA: malto-oligosyltrehalose synthase [Rubrivivax sp.]|nr:malto-oligosyltrehalose synthase [Rubrivivax sp.]